MTNSIFVKKYIVPITGLEMHWFFVEHTERYTIKPSFHMQAVAINPMRYDCKVLILVAFWSCGAASISDLAMLPKLEERLSSS